MKRVLLTRWMKKRMKERRKGLNDEAREREE